MDGLQVIDPHGTSQCGKNLLIAGWPARAKKRAGCAGKTYRPSDVRRSNGQPGKADVCIAGNLSSTANVLRPDYALSACSQAVKRSLPFSCVATVQRPGVGLCRLQRGATATAAQLADIALASAETWRAIPEKSRAWRCCRFPAMVAPVTLCC